MSPPGTLRDLAVIGASAGGVEALRSLVSGLPANLPAGVLIVLHLPAGGMSALAGILDAACILPTTVAEHGAEIEPGHVYVAPPDHQLLVEGSRMLLSGEPPENGHRPAVDALFRSAVLVDHVLPAATICRRLARILAGPIGSACPDCGKTVPSSDHGLEYAGPDQVELADQELRTALWIAVRTLDDKTALARRMSASADTRGNWGLARRYAQSAEETGKAAELLRSRLTVVQSEAGTPRTGESR